MTLSIRTFDEPQPYLPTIEAMQAHVSHMMVGEASEASEALWFLEHEHVYTGGTSADEADIVDKNRCPIIETGRGGQFTYHGPGQRIAYVMLDLKARNQMDIKAYVRQLEEWIIATLASFEIESFRREGRVGIWTIDQNGQESKIAAIGIRVRKWITFHGIALNVNPDLSYYQGIIPCGISQYGVTSMHALGCKASLAEVDAALRATQSFDKTLAALA